jgi:ComF family protein
MKIYPAARTAFSSVKEALLHLVFPHVCENCNIDLNDPARYLCVHCQQSLPLTDYHLYPNNPIEKMFWGRIPLVSATAQYYFTQHSIIQGLMHQLKYNGNKELGLYLGRLVGSQFAASNRFRFVDALVPLPLFAAREKKRGYNQATILCQGIAEVLNVPVYENAVVRTTNTETQTRKNRTERWQNMKGRFEIKEPQLLRDRHILLVDDVVTTGATLESCGKVLLEVEGLRLSIATLCFSSSS